TFDDAPWATLMSPPISVVAQPAYEIGAEAARILSARLDGTKTEEPSIVEFDTELIIRESSVRA
ncbi:MAG: substrate-binding domain-containing protein, partial [Propionibacteriaceae bacterium]